LWPRENFRSWGGGSVFSTAGDIFRWQHALERNRLLSAGSYARLIGFHARPDPDNTNAGYAYGAFVECGDHGLLIERSGDWEGGFNAAWHRWPQEDMTLIILSNSVTPANVSMRQAVQADLEKMMRGEPVEGQPPAARTTSRGRARRLAGAYTAAPNASVDLIGDGPYVWAAARGQTAVELILGDIEPALREQLRTATNKTNTMLANVSREAFATAITAERADLVDEYWAEWESWVGAHGALREFDVLGSARAGRSARTLVRLTFERDEVLAQYFWADLGAGRLAGSGLTNMAPSVTARILAERQEGGWVAYDPMTGAQTLLTIAGTPSPSLRQTVRDSCKEAEPLALV
jgi:hypothetical protein